MSAVRFDNFQNYPLSKGNLPRTALDGEKSSTADGPKGSQGHKYASK